MATLDTSRNRSDFVAFYRGEAPDRWGRRLDDILGWSDAQLEHTHDYIQWIFPMTIRSALNRYAPALDAMLIEKLRADPIVQENVKRAFERMLVFYGLSLNEEDGEEWVEKAAHWNARAREWLTPGNHNYLRISRILTSLKLIGQRASANALFDFLRRLHIEAGGRIGGSFVHWQRAMEG